MEFEYQVVTHIRCARCSRVVADFVGEIKPNDERAMQVKESHRRICPLA